MEPILIILNPVSGRGRGSRVQPEIEEALSKLSLDFSIQRTSYPGHAVELAEKAVNEGRKIVVAAGGDGTANEVLNGLVRSQRKSERTTAMGVIPIGRGNDFAYSVGVPVTIEAACQALKKDQRKLIDVGLIAGGDFPMGRYFGNGVGIGFDAVVGFEALKLKRLHGFPSYIVAALKTIFLYFQAPLVRIEFADQVLEQPALMVSVMNGIRLGGGFMMAPEGQLDDGLFDICIAGEVSRPGILALIPKFMQGTQKSHPAIQMTRAENLTVTSLNGSLPAHADGETICEKGSMLTIKILSEALEVII